MIPILKLDEFNSFLLILRELLKSWQGLKK